MCSGDDDARVSLSEMLASMERTDVSPVDVDVESVMSAELVTFVYERLQLLSPAAVHAWRAVAEGPHNGIGDSLWSIDDAAAPTRHATPSWFASTRSPSLQLSRGSLGGDVHVHAGAALPARRWCGRGRRPAPAANTLRVMDM
jgi:hypothetical protein